MRGPSGALCGYVGLPPEHSCHGADYDKVSVPGEEWGPDVHGGLTYADKCQDRADESEGICHVPAPGRPHDVWWLGFDCAHLGDRSPSHEHFGRARGETYRTIDYVRSEVTQLAAQLVHATPRSEASA